VHEKPKRQWAKPTLNSFGDAREVLSQFAADREWAQFRVLKKLMEEADKEKGNESGRSRYRAARG
jgi:hypothetical protein